ncbi:MAG TPA: nuclease-related domain-containing protein [Steroidobacteraceae bacterium]|nr:nuclease-related domain-containing protein [Steroidobacteraceae bacterium]
MDRLSNLPPTTWALVACAVAVGFGLSLLWRWYRTRRARRALVAAVTAVGVDHLIDVLVPDGMGGYFHVDFLLLTPRGVVVIDLRDISGNVFGGDQMNEWTVMDGAQRFTFINPQGALYDRIAAVKALAGELSVEGRIVFTRRAKFPKGLPKYTLLLDALASEFPAGERAMMSGITERFADSWGHIKSSVSPSSMAVARPIASA